MPYLIENNSQKGLVEMQPNLVRACIRGIPLSIPPTNRFALGRA